MVGKAIRFFGIRFFFKWCNKGYLVIGRLRMSLQISIFMDIINKVY